MAEFDSPSTLLAATRRAHAAGYRQMDAYTPFPIEEVSEALGAHRNRVPLLVLLGGLFGAAGGYGLLYWTSVIDYPINVGGRPFHSWPAFIPITFETTVLCAALAAVFGMLALNGLPRPHHPLFDTPNFAFASRDRFFLCIEARDPRFDYQAVHELLESVQAREVTDVHD
jgi:hypothetical protein